MLKLKSSLRPLFALISHSAPRYTMVSFHKRVIQGEANGLNIRTFDIGRGGGNRLKGGKGTKRGRDDTEKCNDMYYTLEEY